MGNLVEGLSHPLFKEIIHKQNTDDYLIPFHRVSDSCLFIRKRTNSSAGSVSSVTTVDAPSGEIIPIPFNRASSSKTSFFCTFINSCMIIGTFSDYHWLYTGDNDSLVVSTSHGYTDGKPGIFDGWTFGSIQTFSDLGSRLSKNRLVLCTNNDIEDILIIIGTIRTTIHIASDPNLVGLVHRAFSLLMFGYLISMLMVLCRKTREQRLLRTRSLCVITVS